MAENKWLGTTVLEAFAQAPLSNNYLAWLYDYKHKNPGSTLKTKYDLVEDVLSDNEARYLMNTMDEQEQEGGTNRVEVDYGALYCEL